MTFDWIFMLYTSQDPTKYMYNMNSYIISAVENREKEYNVALWGILMVAFWALSTIAYLLMILSDLTYWPNYILNMIFADVRYYLECFIILTFALNELMNSRMELL